VGEGDGYASNVLSCNCETAMLNDGGIECADSALFLKNLCSACKKRKFDDNDDDASGDKQYDDEMINFYERINDDEEVTFARNAVNLTKIDEKEHYDNLRKDYSFGRDNLNAGVTNDDAFLAKTAETFKKR
jgi:hypothetical protein